VDPRFYGTPRTVLHLTPVGHGGPSGPGKVQPPSSPERPPLVYYIDDENGQPESSTGPMAVDITNFTAPNVAHQFAMVASLHSTPLYGSQIP